MPADFNSINRQTRVCSNCGRRIPLSNKNDLCLECQKNLLFKDVKEYIQKNNVNELEVAEHFNIDRAIVKEWIREGHLEYKNKYEM